MRPWCFALVVACQSSPLAREIVVIKPKPKSPSARAVPAWFIPLDSRSSCLYPRLVVLGCQSIPAVKRQTGAFAGLPPSYFNLRCGNLEGFAAVDGHIVRYDPLPFHRYPDRVPVIIRHQPQRGRPNLWYINPWDVRLAIESQRRRGMKGSCVTRRVIRALGVDLRHYDVVTMHFDNCVVPDTFRPRSGIIVTAVEVKPFCWPNRTDTLRTIRRSAGQRSLILFGDGGNTIVRPNIRRPKVGLFFYRW